jgi:hypothetical protein
MAPAQIIPVPNRITDQGPITARIIKPPPHPTLSPKMGEREQERPFSPMREGFPQRSLSHRPRFARVGI